MLFLIIGLMTMGAQKRITMRHSRSGFLKSGYVNYCWTYFFIGWIHWLLIYFGKKHKKQKLEQEINLGKLVERQIGRGPE